MKMISQMHDLSKSLLGIVGVAGGFALDHIGTIFGALASLGTGIFMFLCAYEKFILVRRMKKQGTHAPFPPDKK